MLDVRLRQLMITKIANAHVQLLQVDPATAMGLNSQSGETSPLRYAAWPLYNACRIARSCMWLCACGQQAIARDRSRDDCNSKENIK